MGLLQVLLVATRSIEQGEPITRDYAAAPRLPADTSDGALRLLLQFGLPPAAWLADSRATSGAEPEGSEGGSL